MGLDVVGPADEPRRINGVFAHNGHEHVECRLRVHLIDTHSERYLAHAEPIRRSAHNAGVLP